MTILKLDEILTDHLFIVNSISTTSRYLVEIIGIVFIYLLPLILLYLFFINKKGRLDSVKVFLAAIVAWMILANLIGQYLYSHYGFRMRPFGADGLQEFLFERPGKAFPSDHSAVVAAVAAMFFYLRYSKLGWLFAIGGVLMGMARVMLGFHYVGDILAGWIIGIIAFIVLILLNQVIDKYIGPLLGVGYEHTKQASKK